MGNETASHIDATRRACPSRGFRRIWSEQEIRQSFPIWAVEVTAISVAMAWLYTHVKGSLLLMMVMHAAINNAKDIVPPAMTHPGGTFSLQASPVLYLTVTCLGLAAMYFLVRMPRDAEMIWQ